MKNIDQILNLNRVGRARSPQRAVVRRDRDIAPYHRGVWLTALAAGLMLGLIPARAMEFHVTTAQELQNALTTAAVNGAPDTIWLAAGYYIGNFNFSSAEATDLTLRPEPGVDATQVTIDGAGTGRALNLTCIAAANITVTNLTFLRNCGGTANAALRISTVGADVKVDNCRFLGSTNHQGMGIEIVSGRNAYVRNCTVSRTGTATGDGIAISGITAASRVEGNVVTSGSTSSGGGIITRVAAQGTNWITSNTVMSNYYSPGGGISATGNAVISSNTVTGNRAPTGCAGVYVNGTAIITHNTVTGNSILSYGDGGGISAAGSATISENTVTGNSAMGSYSYGGGTGGGIALSSGGVVSNNIVSGNSVNNYGAGGGIYAVGVVAVVGNIVTANTAGGTSSSGGGIYVSGTPTVVGNTVSGNSAVLQGGGMFSGASTNFISSNLVLRNQAGGGGGGILLSTGTQKLVNNVIAGNTCPNGTTGGGLWLRPTVRLELINNTVTGNSGGNGGGAAIAITGVTELLYAYNNIIWGNTATGNGKDVWLAGTGQRKEFLYNNAHDLYGVWDLAQNNIDAAPLFYDPLHDDYHLRFGSPGIDAGTNAVAMLPATDIDGDARILNTAPDLGADEFNNQDYHPADLNHDWVISDAEYNAYAAAWKNDQTWSPGPVPIPADYVTRAGYLKSQNSGVYYNAGGPKPVCWKTGTP